MSYFDFKQFRIYHDKCAMKVGTDGVLLGAWADVTLSRRILDIGTGSGLIAIMLAQRSSAMITGIEIDRDASAQAMDNAKACPFASQVDIQNVDLKKFETSTLFDNIVSNPPYFTENVLPPDNGRAAARHTEGLPLEMLVAEAKRRLAPDGLFQVILPCTSVDRFLTSCALNGLSLKRRTDVCTKSGKPFKRVLLCMVNNHLSQIISRDILCLSNNEGGRSDDYKLLTKDYYL